MARRRRSRPKQPRSRERVERAPGALEWRSRDDLERSLRRDAWMIAAVGAWFALLSLAYLPPFDPEAALGGAMLQSLGVYPMAVSVRRWFATRRLLRVAKETTARDQDELAESLAAVDDVVARLRTLVTELDTRAEKREGRAAVTAAERAAREQRRLLRREFELRRLGTARSRAGLQQVADETTAELSALDGSLDELLVSVLDLVSSADDESISLALEHVREACERATALAAATREVGQIASPG